MAVDKLVVDDRRKVRVSWWLADDDDFGASLGAEEGWSTTEPIMSIPPGEETIVASYAVYQALKPGRDHAGFVFETVADAKKALAIANAAIKNAKTNRIPKPWEAEALADGWKPPKKAVK